MYVCVLLKRGEEKEVWQREELCWVAQWFLTLSTPWTVAHHPALSMGILQARILKWVGMPSSRGSSQTRDWTQVSLLTIWNTKETRGRGEELLKHKTQGRGASGSALIGRFPIVVRMCDNDKPKFNLSRCQNMHRPWCWWLTLR